MLELLRHIQNFEMYLLEYKIWEMYSMQYKKTQFLYPKEYIAQIKLLSAKVQ
jgi:hypothetical protein